MEEKKPAVFFDRDGVLNIDHGYVYRQEEFEWTPGAVEAIKWCNDNGYWVFVITNQSGIARGYYTEQDVVILHTFMNEELGKNNAHVNQFYYCPHYARGTIAKYSQKCECRKPKPGMIFQAISEWSVERKGSFIIGDKLSDIQAAELAGLEGYLFSGGNLYEFVKKIGK